MYSILARVQKFRRGGHPALAFATIHEHQFPLPHYCEIGDLQIVASAAQMPGGVVPEDQNKSPF